MEEGRVERRLTHPVAVLGRDLDEIAKHIVVANLQCLDAGLGLVPGLQAGDDLTAFVAQGARLVEFGRRTLANEISIAAQVRRALDDGRPSVPPAAWDRARPAGRQAQHLGEIGIGPRSAAGSARGRRRCRRGSRRDRAGFHADDDAGRARAMSGAACNRSRRARRWSACSTSQATAAWRLAIASGSVSGEDEPAGQFAPPGAVTVRSTAAVRLPRRSPDRVVTSSRLARVAGSIAITAPRVSRAGGLSGGFSPIWVRST